MTSNCAPRLPRRRRRLAALPPTRYQLRQEIDRLRDLYELEAVLELRHLKPNMDYLLKLDLESSYLRDALIPMAGQL